MSLFLLACYPDKSFHTSDNNDYQTPPHHSCTQGDSFTIAGPYNYIDLTYANTSGVITNWVNKVGWLIGGGRCMYTS